MKRFVIGGAIAVLALSSSVVVSGGAGAAAKKTPAVKVILLAETKGESADCGSRTTPTAWAWRPRSSAARSSTRASPRRSPRTPPRPRCCQAIDQKPNVIVGFPASSQVIALAADDRERRASRRSRCRRVSRPWQRAERRAEHLPDPARRHPDRQGRGRVRDQGSEGQEDRPRVRRERHRRERVQRGEEGHRGRTRRGVGLRGAHELHRRDRPHRAGAGDERSRRDPRLQLPEPARRSCRSSSSTTASNVPHIDGASAGHHRQRRRRHRRGGDEPQGRRRLRAHGRQAPEGEEVGRRLHGEVRRSTPIYSAAQAYDILYFITKVADEAGSVQPAEAASRRSRTSPTTASAPRTSRTRSRCSSHAADIVKFDAAGKSSVAQAPDLRAGRAARSRWSRPPRSRRPPRPLRRLDRRPPEATSELASAP